MKDVNRQEFIASLRRSVPSLLHFDCRDRFSSSFPFSGRAPVSPGGPLLTGELRGAALGFLFIYLLIIFLLRSHDAASNSSKKYIFIYSIL